VLFEYEMNINMHKDNRLFECLFNRCTEKAEVNYFIKRRRMYIKCTMG